MLFKIFKNDWVKKTLVILLIEFLLLMALAAGLLYLKWHHSKNDVPSGFTIDPIFGDNMVFQQNEKIRVWGESECEGETIYVQFDSSYGQCVVEDGKWQVELSERPYRTEPLVMEIYGAGEYVALENIKVGDLWWVIGQSNVEYTVMADPEGENNLSALTGNENIALCKMELNSKRENNIRWKNISRYSAGNFSALGTYVAMELNTALNGEVPIGVVSFGFSGCELSRFLPEGEEFGRSFDGPIYDRAIKCMAELPVKGLVWYQGEADNNDYSRYNKRFAAFIEHLREKKNMFGKMPVYIVELSPCFNDLNDPERQFIDFGIVRGEVCSTAHMCEDAYVCVTSDLWSDRGFSNNLHPSNKGAIAKRLSYMILSKEYGYGNEELYFPPTLKKVENVDGKKVVLDFDFVAGKLNCPDTNEIKLIDDDWNYIENAKVYTEGDKLVIESETPVCIIRYNCEVENVFGEDIHLSDDVLPAHAFAIKLREPATTDNSNKISSTQIILCVAIVVLALAIAAVILKKRRNRGRM